MAIPWTCQQQIRPCSRFADSCVVLSTAASLPPSLWQRHLHSHPVALSAVAATSPPPLVPTPAYLLDREEDSGAKKVEKDMDGDPTERALKLAIGLHLTYCYNDLGDGGTDVGSHE